MKKKFKCRYCNKDLPDMIGPNNHNCIDKKLEWKMSTPTRDNGESRWVYV